jgi:site-specific DNA-adenine methylase
LELQRAMDDISVQQLGVENTPIEFKEKFVNYQAEIFAENVVIQPCDYIFAAKYVYVLSQVFSGSKPETSNFIDLKGKYRSKYLAFRDKLSKPNWVEHFIKITNVENLDFQQVIEKYDSPSTYTYLDPPYWKTENYYSNHDFDRQDHERLAKALNNIKGKFSLSYYDFEILHEWFPEDVFRWEKKEFAKAAAAKKGIKQNMGEEILILNY